MLVRLVHMSRPIFTVIKMERLLFSYFFLICFSTLCTNAITLLDDDIYDILTDANGTP